jgi:HEAT repeat protein
VLNYLGLWRGISGPYALRASLALWSDDPGKIPVLVQLLHSRDPVNRGLACIELRDEGPRARVAVEALLRLLGDEDERVRRAARSALEHIDPAALAAHDREHPTEERP